jgi:hypothetical protein
LLMCLQDEARHHSERWTTFSCKRPSADAVRYGHEPKGSHRVNLVRFTPNSCRDSGHARSSESGHLRTFIRPSFENSCVKLLLRLVGECTNKRSAANRRSKHGTGRRRRGLELF